MRHEIVADLLVLVAVARLEVIEQFHVPTEYAFQLAAAIEEVQWGLGAEHIKVLALLTRALRQQIEVFEQLVLPDGFGAAAPVNELELSDPTVGLQVELPAGVTRP